MVDDTCLSTSCAERLRAPLTRIELARWVALYAGVHFPDGPLCAGHQTPLDYLEHAFFETVLPRDALVWACRGGGKTFFGAIATLLDLLFKPGIQVRILGGSLEQSEKMYGYLRRLLDRQFPELAARSPTRRHIGLRNGSAVEILAQSDRSVRGQRVQKLRCDELELFDPEVWSAAQLTTRSMTCADGRLVRGAVEAFSTMHRPGGLMQRVLAEGKGSRATFRWCLWDILSTCHAERTCVACRLHDDCSGRGKDATGFLPVNDALALQGRVSRATWSHEMLCFPPRFEDAVFGAFDRDLHVRRWPADPPPRPGATVITPAGVCSVETVIAGVDFGYIGPFVCLWIVMLRDAASRRIAWVVEELLRRERPLAENAQAMRERPWNPSRVYCDPAGRAVNSQTGRTDESVLRKAEFQVVSRAMPIEAGVAQVQSMLSPAEGGAARLYIDPACVHLVAAMEGYRRDRRGRPEKDGTHDHPIDALRYALVNHEGSAAKCEVLNY